MSSTHSRQLHEQSVILSAQTAFIRDGISEQVRVLRQVRKGMGKAYDAGRQDFKKLIRHLDAADGRLEQTIRMLKDTLVEERLPPLGEQKKSLLDFVDEKSVEGMRDALKASIGELQVRPSRFPPLPGYRDARLFLHAPSMPQANTGNPRAPKRPSMATSSVLIPICET